MGLERLDPASPPSVIVARRSTASTPSSLNHSVITTTTMTNPDRSVAVASAPAPTPLPPAHLFDILPALHELLARLPHESHQTQLLPDTPGALPTLYPSDPNLTTAALPLNPKDLPTEILPLKAKIRRVLRELEKLPDMDRNVEEQREEIVELEARGRKMREVLQGMGGQRG